MLVYEINLSRLHRCSTLVLWLIYKLQSISNVDISKERITQEKAGIAKYLYIPIT